MFDLLRKYLLSLLVTIGLLVALIIYSLNLPDAREANWVERAVGSILSPVLGPVKWLGTLPDRIWHDYLNLVHVRRENMKLREDIKTLNQSLVAAGELLQEHERLKRLLEMRKTVHEPTVAAAVIGEDVAPWFRTLTIDQGSSSGISDGMPVLAAGGVVGQTIKVTPNSSRVLLLTDHASGIAGIIQRSRARGVVKGKGEAVCSLEFTMREEDVTVGDLVVTSGVGGVFAKGLPIGTVTMVKKGQYGIFQSVAIKPAVSTAHLEEVLVVLRAPRE
ncbi:MAG: rod shape-determining protein MreC [Geobacter sp.]